MSLNISKKKRNIKKYYSDTNESISNSKEFRTFFTKRYAVLDITIVSNKTNLYQGTDFDFKNKSNEEYLNYYSKRHKGAFFVSTNKVASLYGINNDFSNIIYSTFPDNKDIIKTKMNYEYIYPLYFIEGNKGYNVKYGLKKPLNLINIGNLKNILTLIKIIDIVTGDNEDLKNEYYSTLYETCINDTKYDFTLDHTQLNRVSKEWYDDELVVLFSKIFKPYILKTYGLNIDGWIYYKNNNNNFHDEILILSNEKLVLKDKKTLSPTLYNLPSREQFLKKIEHTKIKNNSGIKPNTILSNVVRIRP